MAALSKVAFRSLVIPAPRLLTKAKTTLYERACGVPSHRNNAIKSGRKMTDKPEKKEQHDKERGSQGRNSILWDYSIAN